MPRSTPALLTTFSIFKVKASTGLHPQVLSWAQKALPYKCCRDLCNFSFIGSLLTHQPPHPLNSSCSHRQTDRHRGPSNTKPGPASGDALIKILLRGTVTMAMLMLLTDGSLPWQNESLGRTDSIRDWIYPKRKLLRDLYTH